MKLNLFKPQDFIMNDNDPIYVEQAAQIANRKLEEYIEGLTLVYGYVGTYGSSWSTENTKNVVQDNSNHTARLICIEEIEKKECEHYSHSASFMRDGRAVFFCLNCGKKLKAKFEVEE